MPKVVKIGHTMKASVSKLGLLLLFTIPFESASYQRSLQIAPITGIGFKPPLQSSSFSSSPSPSSAGLDASGLSSSTITGETGVESSTPSPSSASGDTHSAANASSSAGAESSSANSSSASTSMVDLIEPISTNGSAVVADPGSTNSSAQTNVSAVQEDLIQALEVDEQVTVMGEVQLGELLCDSLHLAEGAPLLQFALSANETILANQTSYVEISGGIYTGGVGRKIWAGIVVDPEPAADEAFPRGVSMTWGEVCDVETFSLEITKHLLGGNTSLVKSVPCGLSGVEICLVEVALHFLPGGEPLTVDITGTESSTNRRRRRLSGQGRTHGQPDVTGQHDPLAHLRPPDPLRPVVGLRATPPAASSVRHRRLQSSSVEIQAAVFYSDQALDLMSVTDVQMESLISAAFLSVNTGFNNSEIGLEITIVYQGILPYEEGTSGSDIKLSYMRTNSEVNDIRDQYGADLVLLVGELNDVCGLAYFLPDTIAGYSEYAYGSVHPNCFSRLVIAHEFGHNLGCEHNRNHSTTEMEYAHGYRYCSGTMYTTIMSYSEDCTSTRVNYFANPDVTYLDRPTGTETENCARAIEENKEVVSNFREKLFDGETGAEDDEVASTDDDGDSDSYDCDESAESDDCSGVAPNGCRFLWGRDKKSLLLVAVGVVAFSVF